MKKKWLSRIAGSLLLSLLLLPGAFYTANANYQVNPMRLFIKVPPGKSVGTASLNVTNPDKETVRLKVKTGYWDLDKNGGIIFADQPNASSLTEKIRFNPQEFELPPGGKQVVRLAFPISSDKPDGEYHAVIYFEDLKTAEQRLDNDSQKFNVVLKIKQQFAVFTYAYKGNLTPNLSLTKYNCNTEQGKLKSTIELSNTGTRHYRGNGSLLISKVESQTSQPKPIQEIPLEGLRDIVILPQKTIEISQILLNEESLAKLEPGDYKIELNLAEKDNPKAKNMTQVIDFKWDGSGLAPLLK